MNVREAVWKMKSVAPEVAALSDEARRRALEGIAGRLEAEKEAIFAENRKDLDEAEKNGGAPAIRIRICV